MASVVKRQRPQLNPDMLRWAREWRGRSLEDAARRVNKKPEDIAAWENEPGGPTVKQARSLADLYDRSFLEFYRSSPPPVEEPRLIADFRLHRDAPVPAEERELKLIQGWAEAQRANALDLFSELGEDVPVLPQEIFASASVSADLASDIARKTLQFTIGEQFGLNVSKRDDLPKIIRGKLEAVGILTLKHSGLSQFQARGVCIFASPLPIIIFGNESPGAQAFTLAHELGHVVLKESGISGKPSKDNPSKIERWCDQFAASFLMPKAEIVKVAGPPLRLDTISDERLSELAAIFRVSQHAMLIRLVHLNYVDKAFYWGVKKPIFDAQEAQYKSQGRPKYYGSRFRNSLGNLYTGLVIEAWGAGRITNHGAAEYMGIKNFEHLFAIRENFRS